MLKNKLQKITPSLKDNIANNIKYLSRNEENNKY